MILVSFPRSNAESSAGKRLLFSSSPCCLRVSNRGASLVSGRQKLTNPLNMESAPNIMNEREGLKRPRATSNGDTDAPNINACRINDIAKFLTLVGKSSTQYMYKISYDVEAAMNPNASMLS